MINHTLKLDLDDDEHFILGDLHGRYDELMRLMDLINYDDTKHCIYSVGDIIDRGPDSWKVIDFFQGNKRYAIKGNHELMALDREWHDVWLANGGVGCINSLMKHNISYDQFCDVIEQWPWMIEVGEPDEEHSFRILHAEFPPEWSDQYLETVLDQAIDHNDRTFNRLMWSRKLYERAVHNLATMKPVHYEIDFHPERKRRTFIGHTPYKKVLRVGDTWFLDTWAGQTQSMINARTLEVFSVPTNS